MRFDSFTATATIEIDRAFDFFKEQNIEKLIIDLRYNGGGSVTTTSILLDKLMRDRDEEIQFTMAWNDKNQHKNEVARFETDENSIELKEIIFLTTAMTASASEIVINTLRPYLAIPLSKVKIKLWNN
jgi:C-terminal processing protease CtpA/Prc